MSDKVPSYNIDSTVGVGINLTQDLAVNEAVNNLKGGRADGGKAGGGNAFVNTPTRLAAFGVYYDIGGKKLAMVAPQVTGPNGDIACEAPAGIADGTYYCNVKLDTSSGEYTALIETKAAEEESGKQTVASVKLFTLDGEKFTQHHTGAVVVSAGGGEATPEPFLTRASVSDGTLTVEMYSVATKPMVKVNATSIVTWESSFGFKDGWQTVYSGSAAELTLYAKFEMISAIEKDGVVNAGDDVRADIFTADGADPWDTDVGETEAIQMIVVPIARVSAAGAVKEQYHTGVLRFYVPVPKVKGGSDSNIAFTFDTHKRLNIDVYYV